MTFQRELLCDCLKQWKQIKLWQIQTHVAHRRITVQDVNLPLDHGSKVLFDWYAPSLDDVQQKLDQFINTTQ